MAATLGNQRWFSATALSELHRAGLSEKLLLTSIAPAVWHSRVQPLWGWVVLHISRLEERLVKSLKEKGYHSASERRGSPTTPTANCWIFTLFEAWQIK